MRIQLSDHFNYKKLFKFTLPSIIMMVFTSIYGVVDGFFVSNLVGKTEFAALNFIYPVIMIIGSVGFMLGTGGSALIAKTLGEGDKKKANNIFSLLIYTAIICGVVLAVVGILVLPSVAKLLGAEDELLENCVIYGRILLAAMPFYMLQLEFQSFLITAEKPGMGLAVTVASGVTNMVLDAVFMGVFSFGLAGAAAATAASQVVGGIIPIIYFARKNKSILRLGKASFDGLALARACTNGSSELMSNVSMSLVSLLYNVRLEKLAGNDGVAAYGVLMYVNLIFLAIFIGYSTGIAPVVGYHYGAGHTDELKSLRKKSILIISVSSVLMFVLAEVLAKPLASIFVSYDAGLMDMTQRAFFFFAFSFLFAGIAIFGSSFFTALNNGFISAAISFLRTLVFQIGAVLLFSFIWGLDGIWVSIVAAEAMAAIITVLFLIGNRKKYNY